MPAIEMGPFIDRPVAIDCRDGAPFAGLPPIVDANDPRHPAEIVFMMAVFTFIAFQQRLGIAIVLLFGLFLATAIAAFVYSLLSAH